MMISLPGIVAGTIPDFNTIRCPLSPVMKAENPIPNPKLG